MQIKSDQNIFNLEALSLAITLLILCVLVHAIFIFFIAYRGRKEMLPAAEAGLNIRAHVFFMAYMLALLVSHISQIYIWGVIIYCFDVIQDPHIAMLYAGSTYTTVGFLSESIPNKWQLLSVCMAISGLFTFGWSTSIMFALSQTLLRGQRQPISK